MSRTRLRIVIVALLLGAAAVLARAVDVMVLEHDEWSARASRQQQRQIAVPSPRGEIRSADGYVLATSLDRFAVQVDTNMLEYPDLFAAAAAPLLGVRVDELLERLESGPRAIWLQQEASDELARELQALDPLAVILVPDTEREYPQGRVAAPLVGFVGREELRIIGRYGLEYAFDAALTGEPSHYLTLRDAVQRELRLRQTAAGRPGQNLELTIHARIQGRCEEELEAALEEFGADAASAVILDPHSGDLLALCSLPTFDPSRPGESPTASWRLRPVQDAFEPGSTIKPLVAAAALADPGFDPSHRYDCTARGLRVAGRWMRDHADPGVYDIDEIITYSSNAGIIQIAESLDPTELWQVLTAFGIGTRSGVRYPAESHGLLLDPGRWTRMSPAGVSLGQELTASPLQIARAYAAIANNGWLPRLRLVVSPAETDESRPGALASGARRVMDAALAARISAMLEHVVTHGTGAHAAVPGYRAAGKTGTAQRMFDGTFDDEHHVAWFAGFLPADEPRAVIVVTVVEPRKDFWASNVAAPVFSRLGSMVATLLEIPADPALLEPETGPSAGPAGLPTARIAALKPKAETPGGGAA